ncbi:Predicted membrane protein [Phaffia rhodozyma]|uniref:Predicted membrane protein n=1 Tax=Phaffia rhodozyma TaxID=264483 RepID=A0A0F7SKZ7_PHARH|nr:Predicted membrane protein [Phaffia rhodozyma]
MAKQHVSSPPRSEGSPQYASEPDQMHPVETKSKLKSVVQEYLNDIKPLLIKKNFKKLTRCLVATFAALILLVDEKSLKVMGQAGFFCAMVSVMVPPSLPVSLFFMACSTILMGMLFGWAWGCAAMAASLQARSKTLLASTYERVTVGLNNNPDATFSSSIFAGDFLDPRSSTVFGIFLFFGCFALGALRAHIPKLTLMSVFGSIVLDVMCSYGPLFPSQQYTLATIFLIPTSSYVAIGLVCTVLIFPESLAHVWLDGMINGFLKISLQLVELQEVTLSPKFPLSSSELKLNVEKGRGLRGKMIAGTQAVKGSTGMLDLEPTYGRLGPGDLKKFDSKMSFLMTKVLSLQTFAPIVYDSVVRTEQDEILLSQIYSSSGITSNKPHSHKHVQNLRHLKLRTQISEKERANGHDLQALLPILRSSSSELRQSLIDALKSLISWLEMANSTRWSKFFKKNDKNTQAQEIEQKLEMERKLEALRQALVKFKEIERRNLVEGPFGGYFKELEKNKKTIDRLNHEGFSAKSLFVCFVFTTTLESYAEAFISFFEFAIQLRGKRPASRLWWPTGFGKLWRKITADDGTRSGEIDSPLISVASDIGRPRTSDDTLNQDDLAEEEADGDEDEGRKKFAGGIDYDEKEPNLARDPDANPPRTGFQRTSVKIGVFFGWLRSSKGLFSLRYALVSVCLWVIAVHPKTAQFNYQNRGLWALIMSQTGLAVFAGEQIATFILRMSGTVVGCVLGMVAWYMGSGHGNGNPYGVIAATLVLLTPWIFMRIALPQQKSMFYLMSGMMIVFIVGYSWVDTHLTVTVNSGKGYELFWKRVVLVTIGFTAGFIIMCFPKITSARTTVRRTACIINEKIAGVFEDEIEIFLLEARHDAHTTVNQAEIDRSKSSKERRMKSLSKNLLETAMIMQMIKPSVTVAKFEPQVRGPWPKETYERLLDAQWKLLVNTALLSGALTALNPHWCSVLVHQTPFLNPELITDIFGILSLITQCLYNGHPLPPTLHSLRDRLVYHDRSRSAFSSSRKVSPDERDEDDDSTGTNVDGDSLDPSTEKIDGVSMGVKNIGLDTLTDPQFPIHATAVVSISLCLTQIDTITDIVRELCGETGTFRGFDHWRFLNVKDEEEGYRSGLNGRRKKLD